MTKVKLSDLNETQKLVVDEFIKTRNSNLGIVSVQLTQEGGFVVFE